MEEPKGGIKQEVRMKKRIKQQKHTIGKSLKTQAQQAILEKQVFYLYRSKFFNFLMIGAS